MSRCAALRDDKVMKVAIIFWEVPGGPPGEDAFLVRHGKNLVQAVFMGAKPGAPGCGPQRQEPRKETPR